MAQACPISTPVWSGPILRCALSASAEGLSVNLSTAALSEDNSPPITSRSARVVRWRCLPPA